MTDTTFKVFLVRHGEAAARWGEDPDPGLSERGREQASAASEALLGLLDAEVNIVSSPLLRARLTAEPLKGAKTPSVWLGCPLVHMMQPAQDRFRDEMPGRSCM